MLVPRRDAAVAHLAKKVVLLPADLCILVLERPAALPPPLKPGFQIRFVRQAPKARRVRLELAASDRYQLARRVEVVGLAWEVA